MAKVRHTKSELRRQKDALKRFYRYLPTLTLKKQQLQMETLKVCAGLEALESELTRLKESVFEWVDVFAEKVEIKEIITVGKVRLLTENIAGIDTPAFDRVEFKEEEYDLIRMPLWVDYGIEAAKKLITLKLKEQILQIRLKLLRDELRITTQRVNLFEKVKIPEARENIRTINIYLGDLQTASVVTGKIAKKKIEDKQAVLQL